MSGFFGIDLSALSSATSAVDPRRQYTPPNWNKHKALYAITFQGTMGTIQNTGASGADEEHAFTLGSQDYGSGFNSQAQTYMFVFDAIMRASHRLNAEVTQHPVQTGYNITDHIIMQPATLTLEVAMSDAIAMYTLPGFSPMWGSDPSKSVSAFLQMKLFMKHRQVMTINTRLYTYNNMVLREIAVEDSHKTYFGGLAMVLTFQEIIVADIAALTESQRIQTIGETKEGTVQGTVPDPTTVQQHTVTNPTPEAKSVPGSGWFSSVIQNIASQPWTVM